jgi:hypothetical protein
MPLESIVFSGYNFYLGLPIIAIGLSSPSFSLSLSVSLSLSPLTLSIGMMDVDVSYESVLRFPALAYATGRNRELLNLSSMGR